MIPVTRLDGTPMVVNADQIGWIEFLPDTVISLVGGEKLIVRESPETVVERVEEYKRLLLVGGRRALRLAPPLERTAADGGQR